MHHKRTESLAARLNDVIVIGAGLSGLSAAKVCHDKGLKVLVLEARDRVGGRTLSDENGCDLGGAHIIQDHKNLINLINELGLKLQNDMPTIGRISAFYSNETKKKCRYEDPNQLPFTSKYNFLTRLDFIATKKKINELCNQIDIIEPWNSKNAYQLDSISFRQFIENTCYTNRVKSFFLNFITPINLTNEAEDCSLLFTLCFIRSWGGIEKCIGMGESNETSKVVGGSQLVSIRLCQQIGEERVLLNKPVHTIDQQTSKEFVTITTKDGTKYESYRVIVALPPNLQTAITFKPNISLKSQLNHRSPAGLCTKVVLHYDRAYWQDSGFNGHLFVVDHRTKKEGKRNSVGKNRNNSLVNKRSTDSRRSLCIPSDQDENLYSSTSSLYTPQSTVNNSERNIMLRETTESFHPNDKESKITLEKDYCPISFAVPDYSRAQPSLVAYICGSAWIKYHSVENQDDRIALVASSYSRILHPSLLEPQSFREIDWVGEEYSRGAYTSIMTPGTLTKFGRTIGAPFGRIAFACSELSTYWPCTMEGAIRSGRKAALKILRDLHRVDVPETDIVQDDEVQIQTIDTFLDKYASRLLCLTRLALAAPTVFLAATIVGISIHKISFRCSVSV